MSNPLMNRLRLRCAEDPELVLEVLGGQGSGNFGHSGRPGEKGGSGGGGGHAAAIEAHQNAIKAHTEAIAHPSAENTRMAEKASNEAGRATGTALGSLSGGRAGGYGQMEASARSSYANKLARHAKQEYSSPSSRGVDQARVADLHQRVIKEHESAIAEHRSYK